MAFDTLATFTGGVWTRLHAGLIRCPATSREAGPFGCLESLAPPDHLNVALGAGNLGRGYLVAVRPRHEQATVN